MTKLIFEFAKNNEIDFKQFRALQVEKMEELVQEMGAVRKIVGTHEYEKPSQYRETMQKVDKVLSVAKENAENIKREIDLLAMNKENMVAELKN